MENTDLRKLSDNAREEIRKAAIRMINKGEKKGKVAQMLGCHPRTITNWWKAYKAEGIKSIKSKTRGRREGEKRRLTPDQERWLQKMLTDKCPDQLKLPYALWTRKAIVELIQLQYSFE